MKMGPRIREDDEVCSVESRFTHRALSCGITERSRAVLQGPSVVRWNYPGQQWA
jgi:hypothetical protein